MQFEYKIEGGDFANAGTASSNIKKVLKQINVDAKIIKRIVVAMYEAEVNVCAHAFSGKVEVNITPEQVEVNVIDKGPGIQNIDQAMEEGYSTASSAVREMGFGAGMGLSNIEKNSDVLNIQTAANCPTIIHMTFYINQGK